jgi:hypothetical protein
MNQALPPGDCGHRSGNSSRQSGPARALPGALGLVAGVTTAASRPTTLASSSRRNAHTPMQSNQAWGLRAVLARNTMRYKECPKRTAEPMFLIDSRGRRPVCVSCHRLGPYGRTEAGVFICDVCVGAADAHLQRLAETVPELRDHRLKRWRAGCDCDRCRKRAGQAV